MAHVERDNIVYGAPNTNTIERDNFFRQASEPTNIVQFTESRVASEHTSPGFDTRDAYERKTDQKTEFVARPGKHVLLQFDEFELEDLDDGECHDWVKADGAEYCGNAMPSPILSEGKELTVEFHSDKSIEKKDFKAFVYEVSKVEQNSQVDMFTNWGPGFKISFELMILSLPEADDVKSIFAFLGGHLPNVPQIRLNDQKLIFSTSYNPLTGEETVRFEKDVEITKWMTIVIEAKLDQADDTFDFVISVDGVEENRFDDFPAKPIQNVQAFDTHLTLQPANAVYKNLEIIPAKWA